MNRKVSLSAVTEGGCHCGAVRYRIQPCEGDSAYCHCRICQRTAGAPAVPWISIPNDAFSIVPVAVRIYRSGPASQREFCGNCGTQLLFRADNGKTVDVNSVTLDDPSVAPPRYHIWCMSRISWFETTDALPRYQDRGSDQ